MNMVRDSWQPQIEEYWMTQCSCSDMVLDTRFYVQGHKIRLFKACFQPIFKLSSNVGGTCTFFCTKHFFDFSKYRSTTLAMNYEHQENNLLPICRSRKSYWTKNRTSSFFVTLTYSTHMLPQTRGRVRNLTTNVFLTYYLFVANACFFKIYILL